MTPPLELDIAQMRASAQQAAALLKALSNENRLLILCYLGEEERSVSELNRFLDLSQSALSQHLAVLRREGLVSTRKESQTVFYRLASDQARSLITCLHELYCKG